MFVYPSDRFLDLLEKKLERKRSEDGHDCEECDGERLHHWVNFGVPPGIHELDTRHHVAVCARCTEIGCHCLVISVFLILPHMFLSLFFPYFCRFHHNHPLILDARFPHMDAFDFVTISPWAMAPTETARPYQQTNLSLDCRLNLFEQ
ncbi:hypothetical protein E3N88_42952 [Mikania micrantha]|uniref:Uncharacterized protein n=1 Tax=Mikania micrantha TaxID=192012 RepID=A0A5N6LGA5_9ASTR|nr:hypothetical protein E3N88_42952 [Mikania micrantha]